MNKIQIDKVRTSMLSFDCKKEVTSICNIFHLAQNIEKYLKLVLKGNGNTIRFFVRSEMKKTRYCKMNAVIKY